MDGVLVVVRPFAGWVPGDVIDNPSRMASVLDSEHAFNVVRVATVSAPTSPNREV